MALLDRSETDALKMTTVYINPGETFCNVYAMPYGMRPNQSPSDLAQRYKDRWQLVAQLDSKLKARFIHPPFDSIKDDIAGQMGGTFFEVPTEQLACAMNKSINLPLDFHGVPGRSDVWSDSFDLAVGEKLSEFPDQPIIVRIEGLTDVPGCEPPKVSFFMKDLDTGALREPKTRHDLLEIYNEAGFLKWGPSSLNFARDVNGWARMQRMELSGDQVKALSTSMTEAFAQMEAALEQSDREVFNSGSKFTVHYLAGKEIESEEDLATCQKAMQEGLKAEGMSAKDIKIAIEYLNDGFKEAQEENARYGYQP